MEVIIGDGCMVTWLRPRTVATPFLVLVELDSPSSRGEPEVDVAARLGAELIGPRWFG